MTTSVVNEAVAARTWTAIQNQRVVMTGFFNSNGLYGGPGIIGALQECFYNAGIRIYGTNPCTINQTNSANNAFTSSTVYSANARGRNSQYNVPPNTSASGLCNASNLGDYATNIPTVAAFYQTGIATSPATYNSIYRPLYTVNGFSTSVAAMGNGMGMNFPLPSGVFNPITNDCKWDFWYADKTVSGGSWKPAIVYNAVPNAVAAAGSTITVTAGTTTAMSRVTLTTTASASYTTKMRQCVHNSPAPSGDIFVGYMHAFESTTLTGVVVAPFWSVGGYSAYDYAEILSRTDTSKMTDQAIDHWIDVLARPALDASQDPFFCWIINEGANSSSETTASVTLGNSAATAAAWADNVIYVISRIHARWIAKGYKSLNCTFMLHADHAHGVSAINTLIESYKSTGYNTVIAQFPYNVFAFNGDNALSVSQLINAGAGNTTYYALDASASSVSNIPISSAGSCVLTTVTGYTTADYAFIKGSTSTPSIDGIYPVTNNGGTTLTISGTPQITGAGSVGTSGSNGLRKLEFPHMGVSGYAGQTFNGYNAYWTLLFNDWAIAKTTVGAGALSSLKISPGMSGGMRG